MTAMRNNRKFKVGAPAVDTLYMHFTGLCGFVPNPSLQRMRVVLVDATTANTCHDEPHRAVLSTVTSNVVTGASVRGGDGNYYEHGDPTARQFTYFDIPGQELWVGGTQGSNSLIVPGGLGRPVDCPDVTNITNFYWIGRMDEVSPGTGNLLPDGLSSSNVPSEVTARFVLSTGTISSFLIAAQPSGRVVKWEFKKVGGPSTAQPTRALAEEILVEVPFPVGSTSVDINGIGGIHNASTVPLKPIRLNRSSQVHVWIENMPWPDITGTRPGPVPSSRDIDYHFVHFYDLSVPPGSEVPHPLASDCPYSYGPSVASPRCPPVLFNPNNAA